MGSRPLSHVPRPVLLVLGCALAAQLTLTAPRATTPHSLPGAVAPTAVLRLASLGEPVALAKGLMLYVQGAEGQRPLSQIDYAMLTGWLGAIMELDPRAQYPLLAASQVYAATGDPARARTMLDFVHARFLEDPDRRWPWLTHATLAAKHRLHDLPLARRYAQDIRMHTKPGVLPHWAQQMEVFILDDMNETDSARALIGAMLASGQVTDPRELAFLERRLKRPSK